MKRCLCIFFCFVFILASAVPALAADLEGGYYIVGDCALGNDVKFYIPSDYAYGSLTLDSSGHLFNLTASTIYLYCPDHQNYTISASRFSTFQYRTGSGYDYSQLYLTNISDTNVEIYEKDPGFMLGSSELLMLVVVLLTVLIGCFVVLRRR